MMCGVCGMVWSRACDYSVALCVCACVCVCMCLSIALVCVEALVNFICEMYLFIIMFGCLFVNVS